MFICDTCKYPTVDYYMIQDNVWEQLGYAGNVHICLPCLYAALKANNIELSPDLFPTLPVNNSIFMLFDPKRMVTVSEMLKGIN